MFGTEPKVEVFPNGLRLVSLPVPATRLAYVAVIVNTGGRDEPDNHAGIAHFTEHMVFKGTKKRKGFHILNRIDSVGGDLNAYTDKEKTVYHATVPAEHLERSVELLLDIAFNPTFSPTEIVKEKQVVAEEIDMYADNPEESIFEDFDQLVFGHNPMGNPILGTKAAINQLEREHLVRFASTGYATNRVVVSVVGNFSGKALSRIADRHIRPIPANEQPLGRMAPKVAGPVSQSVAKPHQQAHVVWGGPAFPLRHHLLPALLVLNNHLGGNAMNTILNLRIREKHGLAYSLYSYANHFTDCGLWGVHAGCEPNTLPRLLKYVEKELNALCAKPLSTLKAEQIKTQFLGTLQISAESLYALMISQGKDLLDFDNITPLAHSIQKIRAVGPAQLHEVACTVMNPARLWQLTYLPEEGSGLGS